jgi:hypothetical protein
MPRTKKSAVAKKVAPSAKPTSKAVSPVKTTKVSPLAQALTKSQDSTVKSTQKPSQTPGVAKPAMKSAVVTNLLIVLWILVLALALWYFKGQFIVATVNGQPIFRSTLIRELERQSGPQTLDNIVLETLVRQEAAAKKVTVTDAELDAEVKKLEDQMAAQKQNLDQLLSLQGMTRASLKDQMRLQLLVEKLVGKEGVTVTDDEVKKYIADNKAFLPKDAKPEELAATVRKQLEQQKTTAHTQEWLKSLQAKAKINNWLFKTK